MESMTRMTREQQRQHNRVLLLEAAERTFASRGVEGASLDDVALEAGLTKGAVYSNFRNKGELLLEVIHHRQNSTPEARHFQQVLADSTDDTERLEAWCDAWVQTEKSGERASYARLLFDFIPYALRDENLTQRFLEFMSPDDATQQQSPIPADSEFASVPAEDQARILVALDLGLSVLRLFDAENVPPELYKTAVMALAGTASDKVTETP